MVRSHRHTKRSKQRKFTALLFTRHTKIHEASWVQSSQFCTFPQKRIEEKKRLFPKFLIILLRDFVPHTAAVRKQD